MRSPHSRRIMGAQVSGYPISPRRGLQDLRADPVGAIGIECGFPHSVSQKSAVGVQPARFGDLQVHVRTSFRNPEQSEI